MITIHRRFHAVVLLASSLAFAVPLAAQQTDAPMANEDVEFRFTFRHAPWEDVLKDLAEEAGLSFSLDVIPTGTFNYVNKRRVFTRDEAIDLINGYLLIKGYTLVRQEQLLLILDLREDLDRKLVRDLLHEIPLSELDKRGKFEITKTRFQLDKIDAQEVNDQIEPLLSPVGSLVVMPLAKEIIATEMGGTLRTIRDIIAKMEKTTAAEEKTLHTFRLKNASAEEVLIVARPLLDIEEEGSADEEGNVRISADPLGKTVFATGTAEKIALVKQVVEQIDGDAAAAGGAALEQPFYKLHPVSAANPDAVLRVLQTMFVGTGGLRLEIDLSTGGIMAMAPLAVHRSIQATITEMEENPDTWAVIPLRGLDPEEANLLLEKMFSTSANPPTIDGTFVPPQLVVRGTQAQIRQIQTLLDRMSQSIEFDVASRRQTGSYRTVEMDAATAEAILERVQQIWPRLRENKLEIVPLPKPEQDGPRRRPRSYRDAQIEPIIEEARSHSKTQPLVKFTAFENPVDDKEPAAEEAKEEASREEDLNSENDIVIAVTPQGLFLKSDDDEALEAMLTLLSALGVDPNGAGGGSRTFYLQHIEAETAMTLITDVMTGEAVTTVSSTDEASGILGRGISQTGQITGMSEGAPHMVANKQLNALYVVGSRSQINSVDRWLEMIDIAAGPVEVMTFPKPRFIQVYNADAADVEELLKSVFANRIDTGPERGQQRDRQEQQGGRGGFGGFAFGRGGFGGRGGGNDNNNQRTATQTASGQLSKMTLGVDKVNNAIVVSAPDPLFRQVQEVVFEIDAEAAKKEPETMVAVSLKGTSLETVKNALSGVLGESAEIDGATSSNGSGNTNRNRTAPGTRPPQPGGQTGGPPAGGGFPGGIRAILGGFGRGGGGGDAGGGRGGFGGGRGGDRGGGRGGGGRGGR